MEEEISLRELIEVMLQGKWLIIGITSAFIIISAILTFGTKPTPQYRAEAKIRIEHLNQENMTSSANGYLSALITALMNAESYNAESFAELVKHPDLLTTVRESLHFNDRGIPLGYLQKNLEVTVDSTKTALTIALTHSDPEFAKNVVNTVTEQFKTFLAERQRERIDLVANNLERLVSLELKGLSSSLSRLEETRSSYNPLITYREDSHLTPEYAVLSNEIANTVSQISKLESQRDEIREFRLQVKTMLRDVDDWVIFNLANSATDITPVPRNLNIAIAAILGLMASTFIVFFINYWKETAPTTVAK